MGFVRRKEVIFEKSTPKDRKTDETLSQLGYDNVTTTKSNH